MMTKEIRTKTKADIEAVHAIQNDMGGATVDGAPRIGCKLYNGKLTPRDQIPGNKKWRGTKENTAIKVDEETGDFTLELIQAVDEAIDAADLVPEGERTEKEAKLAKVKKDRVVKVEDDEQ